MGTAIFVLMSISILSMVALCAIALMSCMPTIRNWQEIVIFILAMCVLIGLAGGLILVMSSLL